jgi:hypothetical protein
MLIHKSCDLREKSNDTGRRGIYALADVSVSLDPVGTPSGMGGVQFGIANNYGFGDATPYVNSLECYDCGKTIHEFTNHSIESYKLERILDKDFADYDLAEDDGE